ncbi:HAD hydrolase family protein [Clostridium sp. 1xD42-85]|nr:hypothetical protein [Roseburia sp. 1XD42-34]RKI82328.1 hypothetical protein D7V87_00080 [Clostridium sp. 1xD42-85]
MYDPTIAFGDNENDIGMLKRTKDGYLLQNATAKSQILALAINAIAIC